MKTFEIKIWGIVQGVGFRPFISKIARKNELNGWVINEGGYVSAKISGEAGNIENFLNDLKLRKPEPAEIVHLVINEVPYEEFIGFKIKDSSHGNDGIVMLPADLSICPYCLKEMQTEGNKRYRHPFISCMECGPRYSIVDRVPYDRKNTAMEAFEMCEFCSNQYTNLDDRRYHAQTISCHDCGPYLKYKVFGLKDTFIEEDAIEKTIEALNDKKIVAIKGIGGFHLACRPDFPDTVKELRLLKGREEKPFAIMFENIEDLKKYCIVSELEEEALVGKEKPIMLLELKSEGRDHFSYEVSRSSRLLGAFLPYTPLQHLILKETGPLIMTSANISDQPIITTEEEILHMGKHEIYGILYNDRKIRTGEDDSVARVIGNKLRIIRRARGYVPIPIFMDKIAEKTGSITEGFEILATGGELKSTFCLSKGPFAYLSQYFGDLNDLSINKTYEDNIVRMMELLRIKPELIVSDMHPGYFTSSFAKKYAEEKGIRALEAQHHHSHAASVMAEHGLSGKVLGISFDGTGYGTDGKIWGSEFLVCEQGEFSRFAHLEYVKMLGGDSAAKDGWKSAFSYAHKYGFEFSDMVQKNSPITEKEWLLITRGLEAGINSIDNSSMGRLFDAVSFLLGLCHRSLYEGDAAIRLENAAYEYFQKEKTMEYYFFEVDKGENCYQINIGSMLKEILQEMKGQKQEQESAHESIRRSVQESVQKLAWKFHCTIVKISLQMAMLCRKETGVNQVALSGGVFQNKLLFELLDQELKAEGFQVYSNEKAPVNDGGISLGQAFIGNFKE